ncbi:hypothetical protein V6N11_079598 [Hibiscus sabdariffa]|uniref:Uncharacterized protein n=1 Tax=Hibiscus sabdariffa TaxID=183260 RepID=A0ABR2RVY9_9ROSI
MESIVSSVASKVAEYTFGIIKRGIGYVIYVDSNVQDLKEQVGKLEDARGRVQHSVDRAIRNAGKIETDVLKWLANVDMKLINNGGEKLKQDEEKAKKKYFVGLCPDIKSRYQVSKKAVEEAQTIITTLAKEVAARVKEVHLFDEVAMAVVTHNPDIRKIQGEIADMLGLHYEKETVSGRTMQLRRRLKTDKRILMTVRKLIGNQPKSFVEALPSSLGRSMVDLDELKTGLDSWDDDELGTSARELHGWREQVALLLQLPLHLISAESILANVKYSTDNTIHVPHRLEGAINLLVQVYKREFAAISGYLTDAGEVLTPLDIKPFPVFWHEDNGGQGQLARDRKLVPGARIWPHLGETAHRLVKSTLIVKSNRSSSWTTEPPPSFKISSNYSSIRQGLQDYQVMEEVFLIIPIIIMAVGHGQLDHQVMEGDTAMVQTVMAKTITHKGCWVTQDTHHLTACKSETTSRHRKEYRMR